MENKSLESILHNMKCAIFDMDGTILDSMPMWTNVGNIFLAEHGMSEDSELWSLIKTRSLKQASELIKERYSLEDSADKIYDDLNAITFREYSTRLLLKEGAREFLSELKRRGIPAVLATATDRSCVDSCLSRLEIKGDFAHILTCKELGTSKSEPLIFEEAAKQCGVKKEDAVVFEDALHAIKTALNDGFRVVAIEDIVAHEKREGKENECDWDEIRTIATAAVSSWKEILDAIGA